MPRLVGDRGLSLTGLVGVEVCPMIPVLVDMLDVKPMKD
jgi:hypothetical protein